MNANNITQAVQARVNEFVQQLADDPVLGALGCADDLRDYLQEGLSMLFNAALIRERDLYLKNNPHQRANGFAPTRQLRLRGLPISVQRPRTRDDFYPMALPKYQRHIPEDYQQMLEHILLNSRSFEAALRTMHSLGAGYSRKDLEALLGELEQEAQLFHQRPLAPDWLVLYIDAKQLDLKDDHQQVKKAVHFIAIGVNLQARKQVLCSKIFWGRESAECWQQLCIELKNRGLTRILLLVTDDAPGLVNLLSRFWPHTQHQLCTVHLLRNARYNLAPADYASFCSAWRQIIACSSLDTAKEKWLDLLNKLRPKYPSWVQYLQQRSDNYLAFMNYPVELQPQLRSTNLPEGINNLIETVKRNSGGHFHTSRELSIKMKLLIDQLQATKWAKPNPIFLHCLPFLIKMFNERFSAELPTDHLMTQHS